MEYKGNHNAPRGPGAERFDRLLRQRAPEKLKDGRSMLYEHALRCFCSLCGGLLNWECLQDISYTETECCGLRYRLQPWTIKVRIEDVSSRPVLPTMEGSNYSDPEFDLGDQMVGSSTVVEAIIVGKLSEAQRSLGKPYNPPVGTPQVPQPLKSPEPPPSKKKKVRRCGICREPGHTRRKCPKAGSE